MCGIVGFIGDGDLQQLEHMMDTIRHRGPDDSNTFHDSSTRAWLGHNRLAIIDLKTGRQPMKNEDGSIQVVFNGEIYNHKELRLNLESLGHKFRSHHSDTEVLVHGWEEWGMSLPSKLNGMFAFAILDLRRRELFMSRDRFGEKPLYYSLLKNNFMFASESSAFTKHKAFSPTLDTNSLQKFLAYGFLPAPNSIYKGVKKLKHGHWGLLKLQTMKLITRPYWNFTIDSVEPYHNRSSSSLAEELRHLLDQAVRRRLMSDVPVGIFLSGGIDSSSIAAIAAKYSSTQLETFTVGFNETSFDESKYASLVARHLKSNHHLEILSLEIAKSLTPKIFEKMDEPLGDPSLLPTWFLSRLARRHVKVALSGDGADELFAGYDTFSALSLAKIYQTLIPKKANHRLQRLANLLPTSSGNMSLDFKIKCVLKGLNFSADKWNPSWYGPLAPEELTELLEKEVDSEDVFSEAIDLWNSSASNSLVDRSLDYYTNIYLPDNILTKTDRASMQSSLEVRSPFLDLDLVNFIRRLPSKLKYNHGKRKIILKQAISDLIPSEIIHRKKKGFGIPLLKWLPEMSYINCPPGINQKNYEKFCQDHISSKTDHRQFLWCCHALNNHSVAQ